MKCVITITEDDIATGRRHDPCGCPLAIGGARALNRRVHIATDALFTEPVYNDQGSLHWWDEEIGLPDQVIQIIDDYDHGRVTMAPFSFQLDVDA